jgi:hypothetical protein
VGRGAYALERIAVYVQTAAGAWWWTGVLAAGAGLTVPGLDGPAHRRLRRRPLFLVAAVAAVAASLARRRRAHRWWLLLAFVAAVGSSVLLSAAGGAVLAGAGAGLWAKAV